MAGSKTQFITNKNGEKVAVVLPIKAYEKMLERLEDIEDVRLYKKVKSRKHEFMVAEDAFKMIENNRK
ncbi:MAG: hypothetical protein SFW35_01170 [Chitinophagales bacterium]|nr:hypothetical protein [Chitinophagales bacterium]